MTGMAEKGDKGDKTPQAAPQSQAASQSQPAQGGQGGSEESGKTADDGGAAEVQAKVDEVEERGYLGTAVDETPRENYTVQGVTSGAPTPENPDNGDSGSEPARS
jgi:hypothetical protein